MMFIGGPYDGRNEAIPADYNKYHVQGPPHFTYNMRTFAMPDVTTYNKLRFMGQDEAGTYINVDVMAPEGMSSAEVLQRLVLNYYPVNSRKGGR